MMWQDRPTKILTILKYKNSDYPKLHDRNMLVKADRLNKLNGDRKSNISSEQRYVSTVQSSPHLLMIMMTMMQMVKFGLPMLHDEFAGGEIS